MNRDRIVAISALTFCASCGGGSGPYPFATGHDPGAPNPLAADASHAYAGRVPAGALPTVPGATEDVLVWREGDFVLANDKIAVVIEDEGPSDHFDPWGGKIVGVARVQGGQMVEPAQFYELMLAAGRFTVQTKSVSIVEDGRDGRPARIRAIGRHQPIPFIDDVAMPFLQTDFAGMWVATDYVLEPGKEYVDVSLSYFSDTDPGDGTLIDPALIFALQANSMEQMLEKGGFGSGAAVRWVGYVTRRSSGYALQSLTPGGGTMNPGLSIAGASLFFLEPPTVPFDTEVFTPFMRVHVGGPDADGLQSTVRRNSGETLREITGSVVESDGTTPVVGADVHVRASTTEYLTRATTDAQGRFTVHVPDTAAPELFAYRRGSSLSAGVTVPVATGTATLTMPARGILDLTAIDADTNQALPARIQIRNAAGEVTAPAAFGVQINGFDRTIEAFEIDGRLTVALDPGTYHVTVSRGLEYDVLSTDVTVTAGNTLPLMAALSHDVATPGALCGDFHIHTNRSPDAPDSVELKLRDAVTEGLEIPVRSDHEWTTDFEPAIAAMGLENYAYGLSSLELTTYWWGHFGVFPLAEDYDLPNGGSIDWYQPHVGEGYVHRTPQQVFEDTLTRLDPAWGAPTIIINHPRDINTIVVGKAFAYFAAMGYDPNTGLWTDPTADTRFKLVEMFNASDFDANYRTTPVTSANSATVNDWFSFLDRGLDVYAVGSSDSHGVTGSPVGYPRTCIRVGTDDTDALRGMPNGPGHVRDEMLAGHHNVFGGVYVEAFGRYTGGTGVGSGETVNGAAATENLHVRVQAAPWVTADRLRVFVDGQLVTTITLDTNSPGYAAPALRYEGDIPIDVSATGRSYAIVVADGATGMADVYPVGGGGRRPFGVTNPVFFRR